MFYMKVMKEDGSFNVVSLDPAGRSADELLHDIYEAKGYADASEEEYKAQEASAGAPADSEPAGDEPSVDSESAPEEVAA